jgi:hypothetical protein
MLSALPVMASVKAYRLADGVDLARHMRLPGPPLGSRQSRAGGSGELATR